MLKINLPASAFALKSNRGTLIAFLRSFVRCFVRPLTLSDLLSLSLDFLSLRHRTHKPLPSRPKKPKSCARAVDPIQTARPEVTKDSCRNRVSRGSSDTLSQSETRSFQYKYVLHPMVIVRTMAEPLIRSVAVQKRILIVDDHAEVRRALTRVVESVHDFEVCGEAENGRVGIEQALRLKPDIKI